MRYADKVDEYLENRPHPIIRHCRLKKGRGENMDNTGIRITSVGKFSVCYYKNGEKQIYNLGFGDDERMPCCSFPDWKCRHIHANIFLQFSKISSMGLVFFISVVSKIAIFNFG